MGVLRPGHTAEGWPSDVRPVNPGQFPANSDPVVASSPRSPAFTSEPETVRMPDTIATGLGPDTSAIGLPAAGAASDATRIDVAAMIDLPMICLPGTGARGLVPRATYVGYPQGRPSKGKAGRGELSGRASALT